jgi:hypothetical protein
MKLTDIRQGKDGDCFILSSIVSILVCYKEMYINKIIQTNKDIVTFTYYVKENNILQKKELVYKYSDNLYKISKKNKDWVKKIEFGYIKVFYNNINTLINNGGLAYNVLEHLTGNKSKIIINRLFDNKEELYYEICEERLNNNIWSNDFIKHLDTISNKYISILQYKIWNILNTNKSTKNVINIEIPGVIGIQGTYNKINIEGIIYGHLYSIIGISIDNYNNKFIHVFNPHHNVKSRKTYYDNINNTFVSNINIDNYGIWALDEIVIFMSDFTYST